MFSSNAISIYHNHRCRAVSFNHSKPTLLTLDELEDNHYLAYCVFRQQFREWEVAKNFTFEAVGSILLGYVGEERILFQYCPIEKCWEEPFQQEEFSVLKADEIFH